jgi:predicted amidohydrolase YtcJ
MTSRRPSLLLTRGRVYRSAFDECPAEAILLEGDKVAWIGQAGAAPSAEHTIDLAGATVLPGLSEAHVHLLAIAQGRLQLSFVADPVADVPALCAALRQRASRTKPGEWVAAADFDEGRLRERRLPTRRELDAVVKEHPVLIRRYCGHAAVVNSAALKKIGIDDAISDPVGGTFGRCSDGTLDGSAQEKAADLIFAASSTVAKADLIRSIHATVADCLGMGLTAAVEAAVGFSNGFEQEYEVWTDIRRGGEFPIRMGFMLQLDPVDARRRGLSPTRDPDWQQATVKFFADGIVGGRTAAVSEPYADTGTCGFFTRAEDELEDVIVEAHRDGWQVAVHAIGDRAIERVLSAFERAQRGFPRADARHRIEHFFCPPAGAEDRMRRLGAVVVTQPNFILRMNKSIHAAFGERAHHCYPARRVIDAGAAFAASSDAPTGLLSPWLGMAVAIDRAESTGSPLGTHEALDTRQAIASYTSGAAYAMLQDTWRGTLAPHMAADLTVVDRDPTCASPERLAETKTLMTIVRGQRALDRLS